MPLATIDEILALYDTAELSRRLGPTWRKQIEGVAASELSALGVGTSFELVNPLIEDHLTDFGLNRLAVPIGTSKELANAAIVAGVNNRESIQDIARRLISVGATDQGWRSRLIARTEVVRSANMGRQISWKASGLPLRKRWLSALTETTRGSHAALHNKTVGVDEMFVFDARLEPFVNDSASVPGDCSTAAHAANCACASTAFDPKHGKAIDFGSQEHVVMMKAFDEQRAPWERQAIDIISKFYEDIETETLRILGM